MTRTALPSKLIAIALAVVSLAAMALTVSAMSSADEAEASQTVANRLKITNHDATTLQGLATSFVGSCVEDRKVYLVRQRGARRSLRRDRKLASTRASVDIDNPGGKVGAVVTFDNSDRYRALSGRRYYLYAPASGVCGRMFSKTLRFI